MKLAKITTFIIKQESFPLIAYNPKQKLLSLPMVGLYTALEDIQNNIARM